MPSWSPKPDQYALEIRLLGQFHAVAQGHAIQDTAWRLRKSKQLIKLLALSPNHGLHREQIMDTLWPELEPSAATNNLHKTLHAARRTLGGESNEGSAYLHFQQDLVVLRAPGGLWTDAQAFQEAANAATASQDIAAYRHAIGLYAGELLPEDRYEDWAAGPRDSLRDLFLSLLLEQATLQEAEGDLAGAIEALKAVITQEPAHETAHTGLMRLYGRTHQRHQGLRQFHKLRDALKNELDAEPSAESHRVYQSLLEGESGGVASPGPAPIPPTRYVSRAVRRATSALAGRGEELDRIEDALDGLFQGSGGMLLLKGEAGVGKSRLTQETLYRAASRDAHALWGAAYEQETQLPYGPFLEAFQTLPPELLPQEIAALIRGQQPASPETPPAPASGKPWDGGVQELFRRDQQRLFLSVSGLLTSLTGSAPLVLAMDDLQAADEATLELLHFLARTQKDSPVLFIGTYRPEDLEQAPRLVSFLAAAQRERLATRLDLPRLGQHETESLIVSLLGAAPIDRHVFESVFEFSEGNPFYAEEFVRSLREAGDLALVDGRWRLRHKAYDVPQALAEVITQRSMRLQPVARQALGLMSVMGREVSYRLLRAVAGIPESELLDSLDEAIAHGVLEESPQGYRFVHPLQREVLYRDITRARRTSMHGHVAHILEREHQERLDSHAAEIAHHHALSEDPARAVPYLKTAARQAAAVFANEQAVRRHKQAIAIIDAEDADTQSIELASLLEEAGDVLQRMAGTEKSEPYYVRATQLAMDCGDSAWGARLRAKAALSAITGGDIEQAGELLRTTLETMNEQWPQLVVARTYYALAQLRWHSAQHKEALEAAEMAMQAAGSSQDSRAKAQAFEVMALACHSLGDWQKGIEYELQRNKLGVGGFDTDEAFDAHL